MNAITADWNVCPTAQNQEIESIVKDTDRKQGVLSESAVLVGVELPNSEAAKDNLDELAGLVETAGAEVVGRLTQKRVTPDQKTYLGKGKVEELELIIR